MAGKRKDRDIARLIQANFLVQKEPDSSDCYVVTFNGPKDTLYENGTWRLRVFLPMEYPYKSPSIGFLNNKFRPNVDFRSLISSGSISLEFINQAWTHIYELVNIFESFLPQLLLYPNPKGPLNIEAANLFNLSRNEYELAVRTLVVRHACGKELVQDLGETKTRIHKASTDY